MKFKKILNGTLHFYAGAFSASPRSGGGKAGDHRPGRRVLCRYYTRLGSYAPFWRYSRGSVTSSGNKATGTAYFTDGNIIRTLTLTLTCSPDGVVS